MALQCPVSRVSNMIGTDTQDECKEQLMSFVNLWNTATENRFYPIIGNHEYYSNWQNPGDYKGGITMIIFISYG